MQRRGFHEIPLDVEHGFESDDRPRRAPPGLGLCVGLAVVAMVALVSRRGSPVIDEDAHDHSATAFADPPRDIVERRGVELDRIKPLCRAELAARAIYHGNRDSYKVDDVVDVLASWLTDSDDNAIAAPHFGIHARIIAIRRQHSVISLLNPAVVSTSAETAVFSEMSTLCAGRSVMMHRPLRIEISGLHAQSLTPTTIVLRDAEAASVAHVLAILDGYDPCT
jgi:peptide deformylase